MLMTAARMQADLIEHARKKDKAAGLIVRTARQLFAHDVEIVAEAGISRRRNSEPRRCPGRNILQKRG
jgi:hypothetical protein